MNAKLTVIALLAYGAFAQTVAPDLRVVEGRLFNVPKSILWKPFAAECLTVLDNGVVVQEVKTNQVWKVDPVNDLEAVGAYRSSPPARHLISQQIIPGKKFFVRNYPAVLQPTTGKYLRGMAINCGTIKIGEDTLELWDYGVRYLSTNQLSSAAAP